MFESVVDGLLFLLLVGIRGVSVVELGLVLGLGGGALLVSVLVCQKNILRLVMAMRENLQVG